MVINLLNVLIEHLNIIQILGVLVVDIISNSRLHNPNQGTQRTNKDKATTGWWLSPTPLKNMNVNWDDYYQYMGK